MKTCVLSAVYLPQTIEEDVLIPNVGMKEEEIQKISCSSLHLRRWSSSLDGEFLTRVQTFRWIESLQKGV